MNIFIVGVGMGDTKYLTKIAEEKIKNDVREDPGHPGGNPAAD